MKKKKTKTFERARDGAYCPIKLSYQGWNQGNW